MIICLFIHSFICYNERLVTFKLFRPPVAPCLRKIKTLFSCARVLQSGLVSLLEFAAHIELHFCGSNINVACKIFSCILFLEMCSVRSVGCSRVVSCRQYKYNQLPYCWPMFPTCHFNFCDSH
jgi:hypothetical protein